MIPHVISLLANFGLGDISTRVPILNQGFQDLEDGQHLGDQRPHGRVGKVSSDTDASTEAIRYLVRAR